MIASCEELQKKIDKCEHEIHSKDTRLACLEGQLAQSKRSLEQESNKVGWHNSVPHKCPCMYAIVNSDAYTYKSYMYINDLVSWL